MTDLPTMSGPGAYVIRVRGSLDPRATHRLCGMALESTTREDGVTVSTLQGGLPDQGALMGVLNALYAWQLPILSVKHAPEGKENEI